MNHLKLYLVLIIIQSLLVLCADVDVCPRGGGVWAWFSIVIRPRGPVEGGVSGRYPMCIRCSLSRPVHQRSGTQANKCRHAKNCRQKWRHISQMCPFCTILYFCCCCFLSCTIIFQINNKYVQDLWKIQ